MSHRATFTLDSEAYNYLISAGHENKSAFVNNLLVKEKRRALDIALVQANLEEAEDEEYQKELAVWDSASEDGLLGV